VVDSGRPIAQGETKEEILKKTTALDAGNFLSLNNTAQ
jgi:hypothetical protein